MVNEGKVRILVENRPWAGFVPHPPPGEGAGVGGFFVREIFVYILFNVRNAGAGRGINCARRELTKQLKYLDSGFSASWKILVHATVLQKRVTVFTIFRQKRYGPKLLYRK